MNELFVKNGQINRDFISYNEFYSEEYFKYIKSDIGYNGEKAAAFGFSPGVLLYNGFHTIDGMRNIFPLSYNKKFERLIKPALDLNYASANYWRSSGGRLYFYIGNMIVFPPTKNRTSTIDGKVFSFNTNLNIDIDVFKNEFNGKYIFSIYGIENADDLNLKLKKIYNGQGIYTIFLYETS
jgi:hypothetical protein